MNGYTWDTSFKDLQRKSFLIKLTNDELPTLSKLAIRRLDLYKQVKCITCGFHKEETINHLLECSAYKKQMEEAWNKGLEGVLKNFRELLQERKNEAVEKNARLIIEDREEIEEIDKWISRLVKQVSTTSQDTLSFCVGLIRSNLIHKMADLKCQDKRIRKEARK